MTQQTWMQRMGGASRSTSGRVRRGSELQLCWKEASEVRQQTRQWSRTTMCSFCFRGEVFVQRLILAVLCQCSDANVWSSPLFLCSASFCPSLVVSLGRVECWMRPRSCNAACGPVAAWAGLGSGQLSLAQPYTLLARGRKTHLAGQLTCRSPPCVCLEMQLQKWMAGAAAGEHGNCSVTQHLHCSRLFFCCHLFVVFSLSVISRLYA